MRYRLVVFGVKDTSETMIEYIHGNLAPVDLVVTIAQEVQERNAISGYKGLRFFEDRDNITVYEAESYSLDDPATASFFEDNTFELGIVCGWQRLIPKAVLDRFAQGVFGFHGNCGYLPFGRGRSPLNWSLLLGDTRFNLNLFRYDEHADSPNVFATEMFSLNVHDDIRTAQYKNLIASKRLTARLIAAWKEGGRIPYRTDSRDFNTWYGKRTPEDGRVDFHARTREIYNLIRAVAYPFPGAFCYVLGKGEWTQENLIRPQTKEDRPEGGVLLKIRAAQPFDEMMDFSAYSPGEIIDIFDGALVVRTVDGSLLIKRHECGMVLEKGMLLC